MKKIFSVLLSFTLVASLCACGNGSTGPNGTMSGNTDNPSDEKQEILEALTSDDGQWGCFAGDENNSLFSSTGPRIYIYRFMEDGTFVSSEYRPVSYNMGIDYVGGWEGTYEIGDDEIEYTYQLTTESGTETKTRAFSYTYEDGVLELSVPSGQYHKDDWDGIVEDIRESGVFDMIEEYRLDS